MSRNSPLRIVVVGRDVSIAPLEQLLLAHGSSNYICAPTLDAADWLIRDGFNADLLIVHHGLLPKALDLIDLRRRVPNAIVLPTSSRCDGHELNAALAAASRRREQASAASKTPKQRFFPVISRRLAVG